MLLQGLCSAPACGWGRHRRLLRSPARIKVQGPQPSAGRRIARTAVPLLMAVYKALHDAWWGGICPEHGQPPVPACPQLADELSSPWQGAAAREPWPSPSPADAHAHVPHPTLIFPSLQHPAAEGTSGKLARETRADLQLPPAAY